MASTRIYEIARELGVQSKQVVDYLVAQGHDVKNHMSVIRGDAVRQVRQKFGSAEAPAAKPAAKPTAQPAAQRTAQSATGTEQARQAGGSRQRTGTGAGQARGRRGGPQRGGQQRGAGGRRGRRGRGRRRGQRVQQPSPFSPHQAVPEPGSKGKLELPATISVRNLAGLVGAQATEIVKYLFGQGMMVSVNEDLDFETAGTVAERLGYTVVQPEDPLAVFVHDEEDPPEKLQPRAPVVTIMGHVDHGKTTLLDAVRQARVAAGEAGGITQHIGAYQVQWGDGAITFLDTPGHEAFTAMRSRGAGITDVAILVVAADDGIMPQTVEALNHAKAAEVPIIVALNKIDRPDANPDRVKQQLVDHGLVPEEWGGETVVVPISALRGEGIEDLLEMIVLVAEMAELKANPDRRARGIVIEAELDRGRGPVATVLVQKGTLHAGDTIVVGQAAGRVRAMLDDQGRQLETAGPSTPVEVLGLNEVPAAGDELIAVADERAARDIAQRLREEVRAKEIERPARANLEELFRQIQQGETKELPVIVKGDVQGSVEALRASLLKLSNEEVAVNIIHAAVGGITETDVNLASTANAVIIGFNVRPDTTARKAAEREKVDMRMYRVIYEAIDEVEKALEGMLDPEYEEVVLGRAEVRQLFRVPNAGVVAGSYVTEGRIVRGASVRVIRDGVVVHEGEMDSLRRFKDDVREVAQGYECGIGIERYNDVKEGDVLEAYRMEEVPR